MRVTPRWLLVLAACACSHSPPPAPPTPAPAAPASPSRVATASFASPSLGVDKRYVVYLPAGYDGGDRRFPVIYMLHGLSGNETMWPDKGNLKETADWLGLAAIVVMPDGDSSFYVNWASPVDPATCTGNPFNPREKAEDYCVKQARYEDYVTKDLIEHVDATYRTIPEARARGIGGLSMGGFGALALGLRHPELFSAVASHSGVDALLYAGPHPYEQGKEQILEDVSQWGKDFEPFGGFMRAIFGSDAANWRAHDPAVLAPKVAQTKQALYLDCGTEDGFALHDGMQYLHDVLGAAGVAHTYYLGPGAHNFGFWRERLDDSLVFFAAHFAAAESASR